jgi:hypothetical protein
MTRPRQARLRAPALALVANVLAGCAADPRAGYSTTATFDGAVHTIAAPVFDNATFHHGYEMQLTEALHKELVRSTPWTVTRDDRADTTLSGTITDVRLRKLATDRVSGLVQELAVDVAVDFKWVDNRTGRTLLARRNFRASGGFAPTNTIGERIETGEHAALEALARDIVEELRADW